MAFLSELTAINGLSRLTHGQRSGYCGGDLGWDTMISLEGNRVGGGVILSEEEFALAKCMLVRCNWRDAGHAVEFALHCGSGDAMGG